MYKFNHLNILVMDNDLESKMTWKKAKESCKDGWRLPTIKELRFFALLHRVNSGMFLFNSKDDYSDGYYWSSEENLESSKKTETKYAWFVDLNSGKESNNKKSYELRVRLVRDI